MKIKGFVTNNKKNQYKNVSTLVFRYSSSGSQSVIQDQQYQHHLGTCWKGGFLDSTLNLLHRHFCE